MPVPPPGAARSARINGAVLRHLANATLQLTPGGPAWAAMYGMDQPDRSPFADAATVPAHAVSMWIAGVGDIAEGQQVILATAQWPSGQACRITTPVVPDADGWATFGVVPLAPAAPVTP